MCTFIASFQGDYILIAGNRDNPPRRTHSEHFDRDGIFYPIDPSKGGTWLGAAADGSVASLLNGYHDVPDSFVREQSRGYVVPQLLRQKSLTEENVKGMDTFVAFLYDNTTKQKMMYEWDTQELISKPVDDDLVLIVSSSEGYRKKRTAYIQPQLNNSITKERLITLMAAHEPYPHPGSVCMHWFTSKTIASSIIEITPEYLQFDSMSGSPCENRDKNKRPVYTTEKIFRF